MKTLRAALATAADTLAQAGVGSPRTDAELLAAHVAGADRGRLALLDEPDQEFFERFSAAVQQRAQRIPLQHITGQAPFGPVVLDVGPGVFVPRPETESLLEWACAQKFPPSPVIVDLCTGSGALAVALASAMPDARVIAVDDDATALAYARRNTAGRRVDVIAGDVMDPDLLPDLDAKVDLVIANPPYIPDGAELEPEVAQHDPTHALFGGPDGMAVIVPIVRQAARWLAPDGLIAVEHDDTTAGATVAALEATGAYRDITARRDLTGRPRFVTAQRRAQE
jgi:release factor glutamine methyltransferase